MFLGIVWLEDFTTLKNGQKFYRASILHYFQEIWNSRYTSYKMHTVQRLKEIHLSELNHIIFIVVHTGKMCIQVLLVDKIKYTIHSPSLTTKKELHLKKNHRMSWWKILTSNNLFLAVAYLHERKYSSELLFKHGCHLYV